MSQEWGSHAGALQMVSTRLYRYLLVPPSFERIGKARRSQLQQHAQQPVAVSVGFECCDSLVQLVISDSGMAPTAFINGSPTGNSNQAKESSAGGRPNSDLSHAAAPRSPRVSTSSPRRWEAG